MGGPTLIRRPPLAYGSMSFRFESLTIPGVLCDATLDGGVAWDDPVIGVPWPVDNPSLSERDLSLPRLESAVSPFRYGQ